MDCPVCDKKIIITYAAVYNRCNSSDDHEYHYFISNNIVVRIDSCVIVRRCDNEIGHWGYISGKGISKYFDEFQSDEKIFKYIDQIKLLM